jgi:hypothetical protein
LCLGWINAVNFCWRTPFDKEFSEGTIAAPDVDPFEARGCGYPIKKRFAYPLAPISHVPLVRLSVVKSDLSFSHPRSPFCADNYPIRIVDYGEPRKPNKNHPPVNQALTLGHLGACGTTRTSTDVRFRAAIRRTADI